MDFATSIKTCFSKYADFNGRASRPEYWWFILFIIICDVVFYAINHLLYFIFALAVFLPSLGAAVRRLHDTGKSGWWLLIGFIPLIGGLILIYFLVQPPSGEASSS